MTSKLHFPKAKTARAIVAMIDALTVNETASIRYHIDLELRKILNGRASRILAQTDKSKRDAATRKAARN